jgi:hypothetical protein
MPTSMAATISLLLTNLADANPGVSADLTIETFDRWSNSDNATAGACTCYCAPGTATLVDTVLVSPTS